MIKRLNGWQRAWIVLSVIWLLTCMSISIITRPNSRSGYITKFNDSKISILNKSQNFVDDEPRLKILYNNYDIKKTNRKTYTLGLKKDASDHLEFNPKRLDPQRNKEKNKMKSVDFDPDEFLRKLDRLPLISNETDSFITFSWSHSYILEVEDNFSTILSFLFDASLLDGTALYPNGTSIIEKSINGKSFINALTKYYNSEKKVRRYNLKKHVIFTIKVIFLPCILIYIFGFSISWIRQGFKRK